MSAILAIPNSLPPSFLVIAQDHQERIRALVVESASIIAIGDEDGMKVADLLNRKLAAERKALGESRLTITRQLDALADGLRAQEKAVAAPVLLAEGRLAQLIRGFTDAENAKREAARRAAEEQRARMQAEEDARVEAERLKLQKEAQERAEFEALPGEEAAPVAEIPAPAAAPVYIPEVYVPPPVKPMSVRSVTQYELEITDEALIPAYAPGGTVLRPIDPGKLKAYLKGLSPAAREAFKGAVLHEGKVAARKG